MRPACLRAQAPLRLALPRGRLAGAGGERLGGGTGSSLELHDMRDYVLGDDIRHLDWRAYARSDRPQVRLYRDEIAPFVDIVLDLSASMAVTEAKLQALRDLAGALPALAQRAGGRPRLLRADGYVCVPADADRLVPEGVDAARLLPRTPLKAQGIRILISDLLGPRDPIPDLARLGHGAAHLVVIQLLDPWEMHPVASGPMELIDSETGHAFEVDLDEAALARYAGRLARLQAACGRAVRASGGVFCAVAAEEPERMLRGALLRRAVLEPAA